MERHYTPDDVVSLGLLPGVTKSGLAQMRWKGSGPRYVRISPRKIAYSESSLAGFIAEREELSTREQVTGAFAGDYRDRVGT